MQKHGANLETWQLWFAHVGGKSQPVVDPKTRTGVGPPLRKDSDRC